MAFAACARQSAPGGFKRQSNPTIGRGDIEYLHLLIGQGGKPLLVFVPLCLLACVRFEKKKKEKTPEVATVPRKG
jgi:hypothetical protein